MREKILKQPLELISDEILSEEKNYIILGGSGTGKTSILKSIREKSQDYVILNSMDFVFINKELNLEEMDHFIELLLFTKIYDTVFKPGTKLIFADKKRDIEKEVNEFYGYLLGHNEKPKGFYNHMQITEQLLEIIEIDEGKVNFIFDDYHKIPKKIRNRIMEYSKHFNKRIITSEYNEEVIKDFEGSVIVEPIYSQDKEFLKHYIDQIVMKINKRTFSKYNDEELNKHSEEHCFDLVALIGESQIDSIIEKSNGNLNYIARMIEEIMPVIHEFGYDRARKMMNTNCNDKQKKLI